MRLEILLDTLHHSITQRWYFQAFTVFTRLILAIGFIPPSYIKIVGRPFTMLPDSDPVGHYFNALYQTGFYYQFIGWAQMAAAVLLLFPRTAHLGAMMFLPIILNIAVLTTSVGFRGTWIVTTLMSLAATWLVAWEYDRLKPIVFRTRSAPARRLPYQFLLLPLIFAFGGAAFGGVWAVMRLGNFNNYYAVTAMLSVTGLVFGLIAALHLRSMKVGKLDGQRAADIP